MKMKYLLWSSLFLFCIISLVGILKMVSSQTQNVCLSDACLHSASILKKSINPNILPCDDFYKYACGNWNKTHPTITDYIASSTMEERRYTNIKELFLKHFDCRPLPICYAQLTAYECNEHITRLNKMCLSTEFLQQNNSDIEPVPVHQLRKLFNLCQDTNNIDKKGLEPVVNILKQIQVTLPPSPNFSIEKSIALTSKLTGIDVFFHIGVSPNPYNQTLNRISISQPLESDLAKLPQINKLTKKKLTNEAVPTLSKTEYVTSVITHICSKSEIANCRGYFSHVENGSTSDGFKKTKLYLDALEAVTTKRYPKTSPATMPQIYSLQYLQNITDEIALKMNQSTFNWTLQLQLVLDGIENVTLDLSNPENVELVLEDQSVKDILQFLYTYHLSFHEIGIVYSVADKLAQYTSYELRNPKANYTYDLTDTSTRDMWCANCASQFLGMAASYYYASNDNYNETKSKVRKMVKNIHNVFEGIIQQAPWIDPNTKEKAVKKLTYMKNLVAFPDSILEKSDLETYYEGLHITDDFMESVLTYIRVGIIEEFQTLNKINNLDKDRRILTPIQVNAFYDPERNSIIIPAGILGFPIYGHGLEALNYGVSGSVIGHEITHGFDNQGRKYNYLGNLEEWWDAETLNKFVNKSACFKTAYETYSTTYDDLIITTNSLLTLTENIADNGGFKEALIAYRNFVKENGEELRLPNYEDLSSEQLFTLAFANLWCENPTYLSAYSSSSQDHSPNAIRVNGVAENSVEFSKIWNCPKGSKMNPDQKCELW